MKQPVTRPGKAARIALPTALPAFINADDAGARPGPVPASLAAGTASPTTPVPVRLRLCSALVCLAAFYAPALPAGADPAPPERPASTTTSAPAQQAPKQTADLLTFIRALEAPRGYDDYERRIPIAPPRPLTAMRLGAVLDWQRQVRAAGAPSTAAGGYQIIYPTLSRLMRDYGIGRAAVFDAALQDRLARLLIAECGPRPDPDATRAHPRFGSCLARIWAALPLTSGENRGLSAHHGVAGNRALTTPDTVLALLAGQMVALQRRPAPDPRMTRIRRAFQDSGSFSFGVVGAEDVNSALHPSQGGSVPRGFFHF